MMDEQVSGVTQRRLWVALLGGLFCALAVAKPTELDEVSREEVAWRISPAGEVCYQGEECAENIGVAVAAVASGPRSGEQVYSQFCTACHAAGILGAPKRDDAAAWNAKMSAAGGFNKMLAQAISGIGSMPPKGTCMDCSEEEISNAIQFMSNLKP